MCVCVCVCVCVCDAPHCIPLVCRANTCVGADNKARLQRGERPGCNVSSHQTHTRSVNNQTFPSCTVVSLSLSLRAVNLFIKGGGGFFFLFFLFSFPLVGINQTNKHVELVTFGVALQRRIKSNLAFIFFGESV